MSCKIQLDNYQGEYRSGDVIVGRIMCSFPESEDIRGIVVKLKGKERNSFSERSRQKETVRFLRIANTLRNGGEVGPGRFEYPFTFQLPSNIPSSYTGALGGIFFYIKVKVDRPFKLDYFDEKEIIVFSPINLNLIRDQLKLTPVVYSTDKTLCWLCCDTGTITMDVHLEKEAFVVGEVVNVRVDINNASSRGIESVSVDLGKEVKTMVICWDCGTVITDDMYDYESFAANHSSGVAAYAQGTYNFHLKIPETAQIPNFNSSKLYSKKIQLKVNAVVEGCHRDVKMELDVALGHIPLHDPSVPERTDEIFGIREHDHKNGKQVKDSLSVCA